MHARAASALDARFARALQLGPLRGGAAGRYSGGGGSRKLFPSFPNVHGRNLRTNSGSASVDQVLATPKRRRRKERAASRSPPPQPLCRVGVGERGVLGERQLVRTRRPGLSRGSRRGQRHGSVSARGSSDAPSPGSSSHRSTWSAWLVEPSSSSSSPPPPPTAAAAPAVPSPSVSFRRLQSARYEGRAVGLRLLRQSQSPRARPTPGRACS